MPGYTRREWHRMALAGIAGAAAAAIGCAREPGPLRYRGVVLGVQSYSFRDRPLEAALRAMVTLGIRSCELWSSHVEPRGLERSARRRWREQIPLDHFARVRDRFDRARVALSAYNISFKDDFSDAEIERGFEMARALGTTVVTSSSNVATVPRVAAAAARHRIVVGMHNHSVIDANEFATPSDLATAAGAPGGYVAVNLDVGHFTAANFDAVEFLKAHHPRIVSLHIKDRRRDQGANVPFGQGDTPVGEVLRLLRDRRWDIPANVEYEYKGGDTIEEVRRCLEYCRRQLDA